MTLVTTKIDYNCSCLLTALTLPIQPAQLLKAGTAGYNVLLPFYVTFLFSKFVRPIISTSTVAKFSQLVELWVQVIILKLVFDPSGDVAMTTKFVVLVHGRRWRPAAGGDRYAVAKSPEFRKKFHRSPYFCRWLNFLKIQSRTGRRNPPCQKQINLVIPFDRRTPTCDRQTQTQHRADNKYQLSLTDPRDKIVLQTELDDLGDKLQWSSVGAQRDYQLT